MNELSTDHAEYLRVEGLMRRRRRIRTAVLPLSMMVGGLAGASFLLLGLKGVIQPLWGIIIATGIMIGAALAGAFIERSAIARLKNAVVDPGEVLQHRVSEVNRAFGEAASLMDELRRDLEAQQAAREALIAQAEEQQRLLELNQEQAEKIRQILVGETKKSILAERHQQWMFFALGALVSIPIGIVINVLVP